CVFFVFFFSSRRRHTRSDRDWSSDVCSSDLTLREVEALIPALAPLMREAMAAHTKTAALRERLRAEQARIALAGGGVLDRAQWRSEERRVGKEGRAGGRP